MNPDNAYTANTLPKTNKLIVRLISLITAAYIVYAVSSVVFLMFNESTWLTDYMYIFGEYEEIDGALSIAKNVRLGALRFLNLPLLTLPFLYLSFCLSNYLTFGKWHSVD